ncbi:MAG: MaoC family dehydratase [bacterium]|nr:acyl dehydratase [Deltaproteobacteria bacterium]MCP4903416.1 MaoC family dehydratase [bacterium]
MAEPLIIPDVASLPQFEGKDLGVTDWRTIDQARIDTFADATGDHQWIHVDRERAKRESPFGTTVAHGYLTIALAPALLPEIVQVEKLSQIVNIGITNLRLREPVRTGSRLRLGAIIKNVRTMKGGAMRLALDVRFETEGTKRPVCTGELVFVYFP